jgi:release factor glutamine methyltransferase
LSNATKSRRALIDAGAAQLAAGPHPEFARREAEELLLHVLRKEARERNRAWLFANLLLPISAPLEEEFLALVARRVTGEPIQYITGETEFYRLPFHVTPDVLIPRPETEHLIEKVLELAPLFPKPRILDVGTGSGAIAVTLAHEWPHAIVTATDLSEAALEVARKNAHRAWFAERIRFLQGDLVGPVAGETFEFVVSNPPYVPTTDRDSLAVEVRDHEPVLALFAGEDGLDIYRRLIPAAYPLLAPGGFLVLEIGQGQSEAVGTLLKNTGFGQIEFVPDLQGIPRVACGRRD